MSYKKLCFQSLFFLALLVFVGGCAKTQEQKELKTTENNVSIRIEGAVYPIRKQDVISSVSGYVKNIYVKNGDRVKKGDKIYSLDKELIRLDIENKKIELSSLEQIRDHVRTKRVGIDGNIPAINLAAMELKKMAYLRSKGYANDFEENKYKKSYINALYGAKNNSNVDNYEKLKNLSKQIKSAKIALKKMEYKLDHADAYAQISGFVTNLDLNKREMLGINKKVCTIVDLDKVLVRAGFSTGLLPFIYTGKKVDITFVTTPPYKTSAKITQVNPIVNPAFGRMTIETIVPNHNYILQFGTRALVTIPLSKKGQAQVKKYFLQNKRNEILEIKSKI